MNSKPRENVRVSRHTPGPWRIEENHSLDLTEIVVTDDQPPYVATVHHCRPDYEANARLIAKAPELLEVVERVYEYECEQMKKGNHSFHDEEIEEWGKLIAQVKGGR